MSIRQYDPRLVLFTVFGIPIDGFAEDSFITVERNQDAFQLHVGAGGEVARSKSSDRSGTVTIKLMQTAAANDALSEIAVSDEDVSDGVGALMVKDAGGNTLVHDGNAFIKKMPKADFGKVNGEREWVFLCPNLDMFVGSSLAV